MPHSNPYPARVLLPTDAQKSRNFTHFDLIMMDLSMPGQNGFEVTKAIRNYSFLNKNTPIVALSVHDEAYLFAHIQRTQLDGLMSKPFTHLNAAELINLLNESALRTPNGA